MMDDRSTARQVHCVPPNLGSVRVVLSELNPAPLGRPGLTLGDCATRRYAPMLREGAIVSGRAPLVRVEGGRDDERLGHVGLFGGDWLFV